MANDYKRTVNGMEDAINTHVKTHKGGDPIVTGWIVIASVQDAEEGEMDGYIMQSSLAMPHHVQVGLLSLALDDKRNLGILSTLRSLIGDEKDD